MQNSILALNPPRLVCNISVAHVVLQLLLDHFKRSRSQQMHTKPLLASEMVVYLAVMAACVGFCALCLHRVYDITYDITHWHDILTTLLPVGLPIFGLGGPLSSVLGPRSDRCGCSILAARSACSSRWDAAMGPRLCDPLHKLCGGLHAESQPRGTVFGGAEPLTKSVKAMSKWRKVPCERMVSF